MKTKLSDVEIAEHIDKLDRIGYTLLKNVIPKEAVAEMAAAFEPVYAENLDTIINDPNRGPMRHYITLPFARPFYQEGYHGNADLFAIARAILGADTYAMQFASDTPAKGSIYQDWHSDLERVYDENGKLSAAIAVAANTSFIDVTPENGPFEVCEGSHHIPDAIEKLTNGELDFKPVYLTIGDILIRDPRCVHRGSPNTTATIRPVAVLTFEPEGTERAGLKAEARISQDVFDTISEDERYMYRKVPVKDE